MDQRCLSGMNRKVLMIFAGILLFLAAIVVLVVLADQSGYGKPAPAIQSAWTVNAELPRTNSNAATK